MSPSLGEQLTELTVLIETGPEVCHYGRARRFLCARFNIVAHGVFQHVLKLAPFAISDRT